MEHEVDFTTFVEIPGAEEDMMLDFRCSGRALLIIHMVPNDPRRFEVRAVLGLFAKVTQMIEIDIVVNVIEAGRRGRRGRREKGEKRGKERS
jgi:hypothetical protein